jgi:hypothetical protein
MTKVFLRLEAQIAALGTGHECPSDVDVDTEAGEVVLGLVPEDLRPLYVFMNRVSTDFSHAMVDAERARNTDKRRKYLNLSNKLKAQHEALTGLFWFGLRTHFDSWDTSVGLCADWQVVTMPAQEREPTKPLVVILRGSID